jgi:hypothetical protein
MASAPAIQFKGSGWYVTDYGGKSSAAKSGENSAPASSEKSGDGAAAKTSEKSSETKTESAPKTDKVSDRKKK